MAEKTTRATLTPENLEKFNAEMRLLVLRRLVEDGKISMDDARDAYGKVDCPSPVESEAVDCAE